MRIPVEMNTNKENKIMNQTVSHKWNTGNIIIQSFLRDQRGLLVSILWLTCTNLTVAIGVLISPPFVGLLIGDELAAGDFLILGFVVLKTDVADIVGTELSSFRGDSVVVGINVGTIAGDGLISYLGDALGKYVRTPLGTNVGTSLGDRKSVV